MLTGVAVGWFLARLAARCTRKEMGPSSERVTSSLCALFPSARLPLQGKRALVTGAGRGIGRGAALALAQLGADIVANDVPGDDAVDETARKVTALGTACVVFKVDVSEAGEVDAMVSAAGPLDIIVANAAWSDRPGLLDAQELVLLRRTLEISQFGVLNTVRAGSRALRSRGVRGKVVIVSSIMGSQPLSGTATAYSMAKAAVTHLGRCLASELAPYRINVNVVLPGWIDTPGERKWSSSERIAQAASGMPWGRLGTPADIGAAIAFLCSDAADYITGSELVVDGGYLVSVRLPRDGANSPAP